MSNYACHFLQYRKWDEIENRLLRRELLITENLSVQKYTQCPPDVISDPLDDFDGTPSAIADETQRQARSHQVICLAFYSLYISSLVPYVFYYALTSSKMVLFYTACNNVLMDSKWYHSDFGIRKRHIVLPLAWALT